MESTKQEIRFVNPDCTVATMYYSYLYTIICLSTRFCVQYFMYFDVLFTVPTVATLRCPPLPIPMRPPVCGNNIVKLLALEAELGKLREEYEVFHRKIENRLLR